MPSNSLPSGSPSEKNECIHTSLGSNKKVFNVSVASLSLYLSFCGLPIGGSKGVTLTHKLEVKVLHLYCYHLLYQSLHYLQQVTLEDFLFTHYRIIIIIVALCNIIIIVNFYFCHIYIIYIHRLSICISPFIVALTLWFATILRLLIL